MSSWDHRLKSEPRDEPSATANKWPDPSGVRRFCQDEGVSQASYYYWKQKIAGHDRQAVGLSARNGRGRPQATESTEPEEKAALFIPMRLNAAAGSVLEIVHPRGHVVRVPAVFDGDCLRQVLKVLDGQKDG